MTSETTDAIEATSAGDLAERVRQIDLVDASSLVGLSLWMLDNDFSWVLDLFRAAGGG